MTRPQFNSVISLGNMLQIGVVVVGLVAGWVVMDARGQDNETRVQENKLAVSALESRVRALENGNVRLEERLRSMQDILIRIDGRLAEMERGQRN